VRSRPQPLRVGLTGGIASGKSTVAGFLSDYGAYVIDADQLAHRALELDSPAYTEIVNRFGIGILDDQRRIVRARLAELVFTEPVELQALNAILHPVVRTEAERLFTKCARTASANIVVFEAALLVETGSHRDYDSLIIVSCTKETQLRRLLHRGLSETGALARINSQAPLEDKRLVADHIIETEGPHEETRRQTEAIYKKLLSEFE
jgi:dephospho-CoA kinase